MTSSNIALQAIANHIVCKLSQTPLPLATRCAIFNKIWFLNRTVAEYCLSEDENSAYFRYYEAQCSGLTRGRGLLRDQSQEFLLKIIGYLQDSTKEYHSIVDSLRLEHPSFDDKLIYPSIFVAARVWSMIHIGEDEQAITPGQTPIVWRDGILKQRVEDCFGRDSPTTEVVKLPKIFNALNLDKMGGIQIVWTSNLAEHLLMMDDDTKVIVFHHASFLRRHRDGDSNLYEDDFIDETLRTLALLFPESDTSTKKWFLKKKSKDFLDPTARTCGNLKAEERQINNFKYWRLRLTILKTVFDESEPKSLRQWWNDRRYGERWYTFWIAASVILLTVLFGLVQSIEGGLQVYKAYHPA